MAPNTHDIEAFLKLRHIAIAGISSKTSPANAIFKKFKQNGYELYPLHPTMKEFLGVPCYKNFADIPQRIEGVFLFTSPAITVSIVRDCLNHKPSYIWMHNMMGILTCDKNDTKIPDGSSVSVEAANVAQEAGIKVIAGSCPMQFIEPVDIFHKCVRWFARRKGSL